MVDVGRATGSGPWHARRDLRCKADRDPPYFDIAPTTPNPSCLVILPTGTAFCFGDGKRCAGGSVIRLGTKSNTSGSSSYPVGADPAISVRGLVTAPGTRTYPCWYRNAAAFCSPSTINLSNGDEIGWAN